MNAENSTVPPNQAGARGLLDGIESRGNDYPLAGGEDGSYVATVELLRYLNLLWKHKRLIIGLTVAVAAAFGLYAKFVHPKLYRAQALITPKLVMSDSDAGFGAISALGGFGAGGLGSLLGIDTGNNAVTAQRYIAIMRSYDFTTSLARKYNLAPVIAGPKARTIAPWRLHEMMNSRLSFAYDYTSGNLELYFLDSKPAEARRILGLYLESLRDKLRAETVRTASAAAQSLKDEIRKTPDALLQTELYELMARQIQREKLAQVQANFAFEVVEPPVVPDHYYSPSARQWAVLSGIAALFVICAFYIVKEWYAAARSRLAAQDAHSGLPDSGQVVTLERSAMASARRPAHEPPNHG